MRGMQTTQPSSSQSSVQDTTPSTERAGASSDPKKLGDLVTEGTVVFWKPPPVAYGPLPQPAGRKKGKGRKQSGKTLWHRFVEVDSTKVPGLLLLVREGQTVMVLKSDQKQSKEDAAFFSETETPEREPSWCTFWDHHNYRHLTFIRLLDPTKHVHYDDSIFGFPLPEMTFVRSEGKRGFLPIKSHSSWAYSQPHPTDDSQVGCEPTMEECCPKALCPTPQTCSPCPPLSPPCDVVKDIADSCQKSDANRAADHDVSSAMDIDHINTSSDAMSLNVLVTVEQLLDREMDVDGGLDLQGCNYFSPTSYASPEKLFRTQEHLMATGTHKTIHPDSHLPNPKTQAEAPHTMVEEIPANADDMALGATSDDDLVSLGDDKCDAECDAAPKPLSAPGQIFEFR
jgi:hypothetical protein